MIYSTETFLGLSCCVKRYEKVNIEETNACKELLSNKYFYITCFILVPTMEALVSITNTTFLGTAGKSLGAK